MIIKTAAKNHRATRSKRAEKGVTGDELLVVEPAGDRSPVPAYPVARSRKSPRKRSLRLVLSAVFGIGLPMIAGVTYFGLVASDQYVARATFSIRSQELPSIGGMMGMFGMASSSGNNDVAVLTSYVNSRQILEDIRPTLDLRKIYSTPRADWVSRLNPRLTEEEFLKYWEEKVNITDNANGTAELTAAAFSPEEAKAIADCVLKLSENLINHLAERSRIDAVTLAKKEVEVAMQAARNAADALADYQRVSGIIDPLAEIASHNEIQNRLKGEIVGMQAELEFNQQKISDPNHPTISDLKRRIWIKQKQLEEDRTQATISKEGIATSEVGKRFQRLIADRTFTEGTLTAAKGALTASQLEVIRQGRYLEAFVRPQMPSYPELPARVRNIVLTAVSALILWSLGSLFFAAAREHR
jgi:capsular polysaccharide transport system permease protein